MRLVLGSRLNSDDTGSGRELGCSAHCDAVARLRPTCSAAAVTAAAKAAFRRERCADVDCMVSCCVCCVQSHDIRFVEDNWESPVLGAWGLGWEVWLDGMEVTQFTYFQQVCHTCGA
jgi:hypothetical protein